MAREKNIRHLVGALDHLGDMQPAPHLVLVGDGELREVVQREAARRANVTWVPYCESTNKLADLYSAADLFVHPGKYETFGLVALEAQACGTPVMAVREGGVEDAIAGETITRIARNGTAAGLAAGIRHFLKRGDDEAQRAARRRRIEQQFSIDGMFERLFSLYAHLIAGRPLEEFPSDIPVPEDHESPRSPLHSR
jgi:glycosyltransferase involved in cell wall biosynthesis